MKNIFILSLVFLSLFLGACSATNTAATPTPPLAEAGMLDLREWDFEENGGLPLSGEWAFYWLELFSPKEIEPDANTIYAPVPKHWTRYEFDGNTYPVEGYATYSLTVQFPQTSQIYGLYIDGEGSAYALWINDELKAENGKVGTSKESMTPDKIPMVVFFTPETDTIELTVQISNFNHRRSGFRNEIYLGLAEPIHDEQLQNWYIEAFSAGILFIMSVYHFVLYFFRTKNKAPLYFALLCLELAVRVGVTNQNTLLYTFPNIPWEAAFRIEYLTFFWGPPLLVLFLKSLYPEDLHRWYLRVVILIAVGFSLFMLISDTLTASFLVKYYQTVILIEMPYVFYFMARIITKKRSGAVFILVASLVLLSAVGIEMLISRGVIGDIYLPSFLPVGQIASYSFLAFIFVQSILLASLFSKSFERVESLSEKMGILNDELIVKEKKYRSIFEESTDVIFISTLDAKIIDVSPSITKVLGYTVEEAKQMHTFDVIAHPTDYQTYQEYLLQERDTRNFELELQKKDGSLIDALLNISPRYNENGEIIEIQGSVRDITDRKKAEEQRLRALKFEQIAITDPLTEIYNRRFFFENVEKEIERAKRSGSNLSLILFDIDNFKRVNDTYGHIMGDQTLLGIAELCKQNIRDMDLFARYGGEEFILMMPDTNANKALHIAKRLQKTIAEKPMVKTQETEINVTLSLGVAEWDADHPISVDVLLMRTDKALYQAKETGKNKAVLWKPNEQEE